MTTRKCVRWWAAALGGDVHTDVADGGQVESGRRICQIRDPFGLVVGLEGP
ncbi:hypothetical protein AB0L06_43235 [Spirillospora sp. NPDC052269]